MINLQASKTFRNRIKRLLKKQKNILSKKTNNSKEGFDNDYFFVSSR